jgi:hypothetical protein
MSDKQLQEGGQKETSAVAGKADGKAEKTKAQSPVGKEAVPAPDTAGAGKIEADLHLIKEVYPDPANLFSFRHRPLGEIKEEFLVVLDASTLTLPYDTGRQSLEAIRKTYKHLIDQGRLKIPAQAGREFLNRRPKKLEDIARALVHRRDKLGGAEPPTYPLLVETAEYAQLQEAFTRLSDALKECRARMTAIVDCIREWQYNDPVGKLYLDLFTGSVVIDVPLDEEELLKDRAIRKKHQIPPGYKDNGIGDLLIWRTILGLGTKEKKHLVFVSGDEKADWMHTSDNKPLFPRFELIEEYRRASEGRSFHIVDLPRLLELFGANRDAVEEVQAAAARRRQQENFTPLDEAALSARGREFLSQQIRRCYGEVVGAAHLPWYDLTFALPSGGIVAGKVIVAFDHSPLHEALNTLCEMLRSGPAVHLFLMVITDLETYPYVERMLLKSRWLDNASYWVCDFTQDEQGALTWAVRATRTGGGGGREHRRRPTGTRNGWLATVSLRQAEFLRIQLQANALVGLRIFTKTIRPP